MKDILEYELLDIEWELEYEYDLESPCQIVRDTTDDAEEEPESSLVYDENGIPMGKSSEEIKIRREIIYNFLAQWKEAHPHRSIMNKDLQEPIKVVHISLSEAGTHSAKSYKSTKAFLLLDTILSEAKRYGESLTKPDDKNQKNLEKMIIMTHKIDHLGLIKLTVGVKRQTHEKIEYGITVPSIEKPLIEPELRIQSKKKKTSHRKR